MIKRDEKDMKGEEKDEQKRKASKEMRYTFDTVVVACNCETKLISVIPYVDSIVHIDVLCCDCIEHYLHI